MSNRHGETSPLISDYVLGLLTASQQKEVEGHMADCMTCQQRAQHERALAHAVRDTIQIVTQTSAPKLAAFMPPPPQRTIWLHPVARPIFVTVFMLLLFLITLHPDVTGGLHLDKAGQPATASTVLAATATRTPTTTLTISAVPATPAAPSVAQPMPSAAPLALAAPPTTPVQLP